jgi:uncharacterized circularly permuted ATP-grasp superfamily protein
MQHLELLPKLVEFLELKNNKILENIKTWCISMLSPLKRFFKIYKLLVVKIVKDNGIFETTKANYKIFYVMWGCS